MDVRGMLLVVVIFFTKAYCFFALHQKEMKVYNQDLKPQGWQPQDHCNICLQCKTDPYYAEVNNYYCRNCYKYI